MWTVYCSVKVQASRFALVTAWTTVPGAQVFRIFGQGSAGKLHCKRAVWRKNEAKRSKDLPALFRCSPLSSFSIGASIMA